MTWRHFAACKDADPDLFFPVSAEELGLHAASTEFQDYERKRIARAKTLCARCPVRDDCLDYALARPEKHGVWGGLDPEERAVLLGKKGPRKRAAEKEKRRRRRRSLEREAHLARPELQLIADKWRRRALGLTDTEGETA